MTLWCYFFTAQTASTSGTSDDTASVVQVSKKSGEWNFILSMAKIFLAHLCLNAHNECRYG